MKETNYYAAPKSDLTEKSKTDLETVADRFGRTLPWVKLSMALCGIAAAFSAFAIAQTLILQIAGTLLPSLISLAVFATLTFSLYRLHAATTETDLKPNLENFMRLAHAYTGLWLVVGILALVFVVPVLFFYFAFNA